jgi:hypothetical protein
MPNQWMAPPVGLAQLVPTPPQFDVQAANVNVVHQMHHVKSHFDRFADKRLPPVPLPETAKFNTTTSLLADYKDEQFGAHFGTSVKYLNREERKAYELTVRDGKIYDAQGQLFDSSAGKTAFGAQGKAIFVMDHDGKMYASLYNVTGKFHHSSFLAGQPVAAAGEIEVHNGVVVNVSRKSGHYRPTEAQLSQVAQNLNSHGISGFEVEQMVR